MMIQHRQLRLIADSLLCFLVVYQCCCGPYCTAAFMSLANGGMSRSRPQHYTPDLSSLSSLFPILSSSFSMRKNPRRVASHFGGSKQNHHVRSSQRQNVKQHHGQEKVQGRNWMEKSSPVGIGKLIAGGDYSTGTGTDSTTITDGSSGTMSQNTNNQVTQDIEGYYDLGIHGVSFQTGPLSLRMYSALLSMASKRFQHEEVTMKLPLELEHIYKMYSMDMTAKEAVKAALDQNGLELALGPRVSSMDDISQGCGQHHIQEEECWGDVDNIQLIAHCKSSHDHMEDMQVIGEYDSFASAIRNGKWEPGDVFNFIVRNVPARLKGFDIGKVLQSFDANGVYRIRNSKKSEASLSASAEISSLKELGIENERRSNNVPCRISDTQSVYRGDGSQGYDILHRSDLLLDSRNRIGSENSATTMHLMESLVSHGCVLVDLTNDGTSFMDTFKIAKMWNATQRFFDDIQKDEDGVKKRLLSGMKLVEGTVSAHAVVGYASYNEGAMKFLETRIVQSKDATSDSRKIIPTEAVDMLGDQAVKHVMEAFHILAHVEKDIVRMAVVATNSQHRSFAQTKQKDNINDLKLCSDAADLLVQELIDDGKSFLNDKSSASCDHGTYVSMSPHRLCQYKARANNTNENNDEKSSQENGELEEIFGAHTDTSFITLVPVAAISGLEIFDEYANNWLRPELLARDWWEDEQIMRGADPSAMTESIQILLANKNEEEEDDDDSIVDVEIPWHCRYVVAMPGDLLQIVTRNEIVSAVHRVVSSTTMNDEENKDGGKDGRTADGDARLSCPVLLRARSGMVMNASRYFGTDETTWNAILKESDGMTMDDIHNALQPFNHYE
jgi:hypothetical protein